MINSVIDYLEASVSRYADKPAFADEKVSLSFLETKTRALAISNEIVGKLDGRINQGVMVFLPKSVDAIVAMLGIVYSGNFYTPTNVAFPDKKVKSLLESLEPALVVTDSTNGAKLEGLGFPGNSLIYVDRIDYSRNVSEYRSNTEKSIDTDPVYVYFTSGSTGIPKGVTIHHRNVIDYIEWACDKFPIDETTIFGNQSALYFDITTQDIYATLKRGATMVIIPEKLFAFPVKVADFIQQNEINFLYWVPSAYVHLSSLRALDNIILDSVRSLMFGGEVMPVKHLNYLKSKLPNLEFIANVYGPTEATVNITYYIIDKHYEEDQTLPLGHVIENKRVLLLDDDDQLINESNTAGELCVLGSSVSSGYYKNPETSSEVFTQNPLHHNYSDVMYRTGDLVMYNDQGLLIFCGRKDNQIKHMGYRIEPGEIETASMSTGIVDNCAALYNESERRITLVYVAHSDEVNDRQVRMELSKLLPKYMVPTQFCRLTEMPINNNGKIDRLKLKNMQG